MKTFLRAHLLAITVAASCWPQTQIDLRSQGKNVDFSSANSTKPFRTGTVLPGACSVGETYFKTDATAGENLYACTAPDTWTLQSGASGVPAVSGEAGKVLSNDGAAAGWRALGGDVAGGADAVVVRGLQGRSISGAEPVDGEVLRWSEAASAWQPYPFALSGSANYSQAFTSATAVTVAGSAHGFGTADLLVDCYDGASPAARLAPVSVTVDPATYDVAITFSTAQSGRCVVNGAAGAGGVSGTVSNTFAPGTVQTFQGSLVATGAERTAPVKTGTSLPAQCMAGDQFFKTNAAAGQNLYFCTAADTWTQMIGGQAVASVFGRSGAVTAAAGDYTFAQISGVVANSQVAAGVDATKIGAGTVTNATFGHLANVSGDLQAQIDAKADAGHAHSAAGDASGALDAITVTRIQGRTVSAAAPADGQALIWSASGNTWQPAALASGGAGMASQLNDFAVTRTSTNILTIGANCSATTPCSARFGNTAYTFTRSCTATITAGTGTAYMYIASGGTLTIGHNVTAAASAGCLAQASVTGFPADSIPLYTWTAASGAWDVTGGRDFRAMLSGKSVLAGTGIASLDSGGRTTLSVDTAVVPTFMTGTASIDFGAIANGGCSEQMFTLYGASVGDSVAPGWPGGMENGLLGMMRVSAANTIAVRLCNHAGTSVDPGSATFRATIVRSF